MRLKSIVLCSASAGAFVLAAVPAAAQTTDPATQMTGQEAPTAPTAEGQTTPGQIEEAPAAGEAAQTAPGQDQADGGETIVVTGIRRSLQSAQNIRRNSEQIVDSVVAEDIGKLPDLNTAQTAARIPGVQVYRQGGEAQNVLVRGLPNFTSTYNGREIFTAETRVVALQDFPSSNIAALEVFKTSTAELVEPGLAGLINVRSRRPFDFRDQQIAGSVWGLYTRQGKGLKPNFNLLATKRWDIGDGGEIGALLNVSRTDMRYLDAEISNTDFLQTFNQVGGGLPADPANGTAARFPDVQRLFYRSGRRTRPSINAAVQFRPTADLEFYGEALWQGFRDRISDRRLDARFFLNSAASGLEFRDGSNLLEGGTFNLAPEGLFTFQGATFNKTDTYQFAGGTRITRDQWKVNVDIARTKSTFRGLTESVDRLFTAPSTVEFNARRPEFTVSGIDLNDPSLSRFDGLFEEDQKSKGDDWQVRADVQYDFDGSPLLQNVQFGARYSNRDAERRRGGGFRNAPPGTNATALPFDFDVFDGVNFGGTTEFATPTYDSIRENIVAIRRVVGLPDEGFEPDLLYTADEKNLSGYGQLNLGDGDNIDGTIGVRVSRVKTRVAGPQPTGIEEIDEGSKRTVVLPNASVRARPREFLQLRAAVSKTRTLPSFADLNPALSLGPPPPGGGPGTPQEPRGATGGNPFLRPFTSWNFDAAAEFYFGRTAFASITPFHRRIRGFIQQRTFDVTDPELGVIRVTGPVNTGKGRITGVELQGQAFADFETLPDWARGFGVQANLTYINAKTQQPTGPGPDAPLSYQPITGDPARGESPGVSKWTYNLVGIYERYGFAARLTYNGRSSFRATQQFRQGDLVLPDQTVIPDVFDDTYTERAHPAGRLDLSLNYDVNDQFTLFGDWTNITRKTFRQDFTSARAGAPEAEFVRYRRYDESTLSLGLRFRFGS